MFGAIQGVLDGSCAVLAFSTDLGISFVKSGSWGKHASVEDGRDRRCLQGGGCMRESIGGNRSLMSVTEDCNRHQPWFRNTRRGYRITDAPKTK